MSKLQNIWKKFWALLTAALLLVGAAPEAFATEVSSEASSGREGVELSETSAEDEEEPGISVNLSDLEMQIAMANGLNEYDYTKESWAVLKEAVENGKKVFEEAADQKTVNAAVKAIENAIMELVAMDYSQLEKALGVVYNRIGEVSELYDVWIRINTAVEESRPLLVSGDQAAVDEATAEINALLEELSQSSENGRQPEVVVKEVEVEVPPSDDYCNIPMHRTWPVLFFISLALNVAMAAVVFFVINKRRNNFDDIPLVNYDIDDDIDYDIEDDDE